MQLVKFIRLMGVKFWFNLLKPSGFFRYHQLYLTFKNSTWSSLCVECFLRISEQTATFPLYIINWLVFVTVVESVYCAVRTDTLYKADYVSSVKGWYIMMCCVLKFIGLFQTDRQLKLVTNTTAVVSEYRHNHAFLILSFRNFSYGVQYGFL